MNDDIIRHNAESPQPSGLGRRDFVKRSALLGGMVWAAPAMSTLGSRAFALPSPIDLEGCVRFRFNIEVDGNTGTYDECTQDLPAACGGSDYNDETLQCLTPSTDNKSAGGSVGGVDFTCGTIAVDIAATKATISFPVTNGGSWFAVTQSKTVVWVDADDDDNCNVTPTTEKIGDEEAIVSFNIQAQSVSRVAGVICVQLYQAEEPVP